jgi:hypothetical protein|tara:strand:+ start:20 stop:7519 length:7500 start_codon:yes stop_codon:yes gene_type:complete
MAELKRNFSGAKMNKDMDERVLPSGQYRDALNVQISTSDGSDVGALQTLLGNTELSNNIVPADYCTCVGAHAIAEKDLIYYFVSGGGVGHYKPLVKKDYIIEYNTITNTFRYVFVDIYNVEEAQVGNDNTNKYFTISDNGTANNTTGVRVGMHITGTFTNHVGGATKTLTFEDNVLVTDLVKISNGWQVWHDYKWDNGSNGEAIPVSNNENIYFHSEFGERILNFNPYVKINNINHLEGMLFWTDGVNEPKKIHIERSLMGTGGLLQVVGWDDAQKGSHTNNTGNVQADLIPPSFGDNANFHTRNVIKSPLGFRTCLNRTNVRPEWIMTENITVIKKSPKYPLELRMLETSIDRVPDSTLAVPEPEANLTYADTGTSTGANGTFQWSDANGDAYEVGEIISNFYFNQPVDFRTGDVLLFTDDLNVLADSFDAEIAQVRVKVTDGPNGMPNNGGEIGPYEFEIISIAENIATSPTTWRCRLDSPPALFEFKFPRFSYRWKYTDGEYSTFAPWTQVAFIPGSFDYVCKKGYNLGMTNRMKSLRLTNFFPETHMMPDDVIQVDLLYKEDGKNEIYTVKEITKKDGAPQWPDTAASPYNRGQYDLTSEMIHAILPSNQLLRPWDNVPKSALTQEITSNRLIYGNYKQNYELAQDLKLDVSFDHKRNYSTETSCKTLRTYQVGVVFSDKYGRETPVQIPTKSSSIYLDKKWSTYSNCLKARVHPNSTIPTWAEYMKFYVKETSNEYYNLAMDRWYNAEDGNVWISFPSAERNKVDDETFLILKKKHDSEDPVIDKARYKVIAISEDAPLFVKTTRKPHGAVRTTQQGSGSGTFFSTANEIIIPTAPGSNDGWDDIFGESWMTDVYAKVGRGSMQVRLTATLNNVTMATEFVSIASIREIGANHVIRLSAAFGDDALMSAQLGNGTVVNPQGLGDDSNFPVYRVELRENVVENKAEFDGRFFVKIYRDSTLENNVLTNAAEPTTAYNIISSHPVRFISGIGDQGDTRHPSVNQTGHTFHRGNCNWYGSEASSPGTTASAYGQPGKFSASEQMGYYSSRSRDRKYWINMPAHDQWWIDAAGYKHDEWTWTDGSGWHSDDNGTHPSHTDIDNGMGRGGIRHYSDRTRIYWGIRRHGSTNSTIGNQNSVDFYAAMRRAGTLFRFRSDPGQVVYRVVRAVGHANAWSHHWGNEPDSAKRRMFIHDIVRDEDGLPMDLGQGQNSMTWDPLSAMRHDGYSSTIIDIVTPDTTFGADRSELSTEEPAIWETEPKENVDVDIYFEASGAIPLNVTHKNNELLIPLFSTFEARNDSNAWHVDSNNERQVYKITAVNQPSDQDLTKITVSPALVDTLDHDQYIKIKKYDGSYSVLYVSKATANPYAAGTQIIEVVTGKAPSNKRAPFAPQPWRAPHHQPQYLGWHNCWSFGNGIESDRIRDDYNAPKVANGVKASTVLAEPYSEEHRSSGMIFSGIFNSTSGVNNLNQFIQAEPITKDLSPRHGSIQKLVSRDTDTFAFCEDKVLRILTNKDALFNADGNANVTSNSAVLGQATPINGDYGISTNPESLAVTPFGMYWADQMRGQVLALEGGMSIKSISDIGMKDYFNDNLENLSELIGTYDEKKNEYNLTLCTRVDKRQFRPTTTTLSYNELTQGWVSFKSFGPEAGISLNNQYYTFKEGSIWKHHNNTTTNNFYGTQYYSDFTLIFNDQPGSVKSFNTINYEGTQARISQFTTVSSKTDNRYDNLTAKAGWYVDSITTDLQEIDDIEFKNKEGKWFGTLKGVTTTLDNLDEREFSVQGLGNASTNNSGDPATVYKINVHAHPTNAAGNVNWDSSGADADFKIGSFQVNSAAAGSTVPAGTSSSYIDNLTLTNGLYTYSGLDLDAKDFSVPNGTATTSGSGNSTVYIYTAAVGWNADQNITKVEFRNQGIAGDPANVVEARAYYDSFTMPSSDYDRHFDVDHGGTATGGEILRDACLHVSYEEHGADNVVIVPSSPVTGITRTDNVTFLSGATNIASDKWSGTVTQGVTTKIAEYTITAASGYHLSAQSQSGGGVDVSWFNRLSNAPWASYYTWNVTDTYYTSTGNTNKIEKSVIEIFYTPPVNVPGLDPDPPSGEGGFCAHLHDIRLSYLARTIVTKTSLGKRVTQTSISNSILSPTDTVTVQIDSTGYTIPTDVNGLFYSMMVKLNTAQNGIEKAYNWNTSAWVDTTDLTGNTGPHGIGNHQGADSAQGNSTNPYRLRTNAHVVTNNGTVFLQSIMPDDTASPTGTYCVFFEAGDFTVNGVSNAPQNIALASGIPTNINTDAASSWEVVGNVSGTITKGTITNVTASGSDVTVTAGRSLKSVASETKLDFPFTFTYTRTASRTLSIVRQPVLNDFLGFDNEYTTAGQADNAGTTIHMPDTTGIKVGMFVEDLDYANGETTNRLNKTQVSKVVSVATNDSISIDVAHSGLPASSNLRIFSDWQYELINPKATINDPSTIVTVTGTIRLRQYGKSAPDGTITLQASNFITSTSN